MSLELLTTIEFASIAHRDQRRKNSNKSPYINHPIEVASLIAQSGITDTAVLQAAILHDTIEDCGVTQDDIRNRFGEDVLNLVMECTDDKSLDKLTRKKLQIVHAANMNSRAIPIKIADKISNLKDLITDPPLSWSPQYVKGYVIWCRAVYEKISGHNTFLDNMIEKIFAAHGVYNVDPVELEKYYASI